MSCLDRIVIAAPCPIQWDEMPGSDTVRHCTGCAKNVYNISAMSTTDAEQFLGEKGDSECLRFFRRKDGTIITDNCPVGLRALRDRARLIGKVVAGFLSSIFAVAASYAQVPDTQNKKTAADETSYDGGPRMIQKPAATKKSDPAFGGAKAGNPAMMLGSPALPQPVIPTRKGTTMVSGEECTKPVVPVHLEFKGQTTLVQPKVDSAQSLPVTRDAKLESQKIQPDKRAAEHLQLAQEANRKGDFVVAETHYKAASAVAHANPKTDPHFLKIIETEWADFRKQMPENFGRKKSSINNAAQ